MFSYQSKDQCTSWCGLLSNNMGFMNPNYVITVLIPIVLEYGSFTRATFYLLFAKFNAVNSEKSISFSLTVSAGL